MFCNSQCSGHYNLVKSESPTDFNHAIEGNTIGFFNSPYVLENLTMCAKQIKHAKIVGDQLKFSNFCVPITEVVQKISLCLRCGRPEGTVSLLPRLAYLCIVDHMRNHIKELPESMFDAEDLTTLANAEKYCLRYGTDLYDERHSELVPGFKMSDLTQKQVTAITVNEKGASIIPTVPMARSIVKTVHTARIVEQCVQVDELAKFPPGVVPMMAAYVPDWMEEIDN